MRYRLAVACAYAVIGIATFGHSARNAWLESVNSHYGCHVYPADCALSAGSRGLFAAILWPLYWSWELQQ